MHRPYGPYERFIKRPGDILCASAALIVLSPVIAVTAILVRKKLGSPVLFTQDRPGKDEKIFKLYKFRTMTDAKDPEGNLLPDEDRLPAFGRKLRATSLDELPELFNILKGDMSIVGPRPLLVRYLPYYTDRERVRHDVRPGLTGVAQVHGRNAVSWEKRFEYDIDYAEHITFATDMKVLVDTVRAVLTHDGVQLNALEDFDAYRKGQKEIDEDQ